MKDAAKVYWMRQKPTIRLTQLIWEVEKRFRFGSWLISLSKRRDLKGMLSGIPQSQTDNQDGNWILLGQKSALDGKRRQNFGKISEKRSSGTRRPEEMIRPESLYPFP